MTALPSSVLSILKQCRRRGAAHSSTTSGPSSSSPLEQQGASKKTPIVKSSTTKKTVTRRPKTGATTKSTKSKKVSKPKNSKKTAVRRRKEHTFRYKQVCKTISKNNGHKYQCTGRMKLTSLMRIRSDFEGTSPTSHALKRLEQKHRRLWTKHVVASEKNNKLQKLIKLQNPGIKIINDVLTETASDVDKHDHEAHIWTPPCQGFAAGGKNRGTKDERFKPFRCVFKKILKKKHDFSIFECSAGMLRGKHKQVVKEMVDKAHDVGLNAHADVLNPLDYQVAHDRNRLIMVLLNPSRQVAPFDWPRAIAPEPMASEFLEGPKSTHKIKLPEHERERKIARQACCKAMQAGHDPRKVPILVDIDSSEGFDTFGINRFRTLLHSHPKGPWLSLTGKRVTANDLLHAQGYVPEQVPWEKAGMNRQDLGRAVGNGLNVAVLTAVMEKCLESTGYIEQHAADEL